MPVENRRSKWLVIGGGMMGLKVANDLLDKGQDVTVAEAAPSFGGLASPWKLGEVTWDRFYHVSLLSDTYLRDLLTCLLYTSPSPRDQRGSRMPSSA